ncbi:MAG TPA: hypothetical protein VGB70_12855 [Allosphingosinicella sp.]
MSGSRILSDTQIEEMCRLRERGWSPKRIAEHFTAAGTKISGSAINWQCMKNGADAPPRLRGRPHQKSAAYQRNGHVVRPYSEADDALLRVLDMRGVKIGEIARRLDRKSNSVRGRLLTLARRDARAEEAAEREAA